MNHSAKCGGRVAARYSKRLIVEEAAYQKKLQVTRDYLRPALRGLNQRTVGKGEMPKVGCQVTQR